MSVRGGFCPPVPPPKKNPGIIMRWTPSLYHNIRIARMYDMVGFIK